MWTKDHLLEILKEPYWTTLMCDFEVSLGFPLDERARLELTYLFGIYAFSDEGKFRVMTPNGLLEIRSEPPPPLSNDLRLIRRTARIFRTVGPFLRALNQEGINSENAQQELAGYRARCDEAESKMLLKFPELDHLFENTARNRRHIADDLDQVVIARRRWRDRGSKTCRKRPNLRRNLARLLIRDALKGAAERQGKISTVHSLRTVLSGFNHVLPPDKKLGDAEAVRHVARRLRRKLNSTM